MKIKILLTALLMFVLCALSTSAEEKNMPIVPDKGTGKDRPRMPAANPLPMCVYADGILSVSFPSAEGEAEVVITHTDYTEEYTMPTEYEIIISTDLLDGDTVEISTEAGNTYVAVYEE